jgi:predicted DNA-binding transcriptional regulator YafY
MPLSTTPRLLRLLGLLQNAEAWTADDLAGELGSSPRTIRRDVASLRDLGYAVTSTPGAHGGYRLVRGQSFPPLILDNDEAALVALGLRTLTLSGLEGVDHAAQVALGKISTLLPEQAQRRVDTLARIAIDEGTNSGVSMDRISVLADAAHRRNSLCFQYIDRSGKATSRIVDPANVVAHAYRWFLIAWDIDRDDWRLFRVDRMADVQRLPKTFDPPRLPSASAADFVAERLKQVWTVAVEVAVPLPIDVVVARLPGPGFTVQSELDGSTRILADTDSVTSFAAQLVHLRSDFTIVRPAGEWQEYLDIAARFVRAAEQARAAND